MLSAMDEKDIRILELLQKDARVSLREIAEAIGTSVSRAYARIKKLEKEKYIMGYAVTLNGRLIGKGLAVYLYIQLNNHTKIDLEKIEETMTGIEEIMECYHISGKYEFLAKLCVKDMDAYAELYKEKLSAIPNVRSMEPWFVLQELKNSMTYELDPR